MIRVGIYQLVSGDPTVHGLAPRGFYGQVPDDLTQYPCWSYKLVGGANNQTLRTSGVFRQRVEFNGWAQSAETAASIRDAISALVGDWGSATLGNGVNVLTTNIANSGTDFDPGDSRIFRCMVEFYVLYTNPSA